MRLLSGTEIKIVILQKKTNKNEPEEGNSNNLILPKKIVLNHQNIGCKLLPKGEKI